MPPKSIAIVILGLGLLACAADTPEAGVKRFLEAVAEGDADKILRTQVY